MAWNSETRKIPRIQALFTFVLCAVSSDIEAFSSFGLYNDSFTGSFGFFTATSLWVNEGVFVHCFGVNKSISRWHQNSLNIHCHCKNVYLPLYIVYITITGSSGVESESACPLSPLTTDALPLATTVSTSETLLKAVDLLCKSLLATGDIAFSVL
jgi:hypothetical protein